MYGCIMYKCIMYIIICIVGRYTAYSMRMCLKCLNALFYCDMYSYFHDIQWNTTLEAIG